MLRKALKLLAIAFVGLPASLLAEAVGPSSLNMPIGVTDVSKEIYNLHMGMFWICVVIGVGVFGYMLYAMIFHRKSRGQEPAKFHEHLGAEIAWTVVPFLLLIVMAVPATISLKNVYDTSEADLDIKITGYQWKWQYEYLGSNVKFMSELTTPQDEIYNLEDKGEFYLQEVNSPLVIPVDTKVRFLVTAKDVIHSWWVPDFAIKRDALPGYTVQTWTKVNTVGTYRGECAELCGKNHAFMPIVVEVKSKEDYATWFAEKEAEALLIAAKKNQRYTMEQAMVEGKANYERTCGFCHGMKGEGVAGFPAMADSPVTTGDVTKHLDVVVNGVSGTAMQSFAAQLDEAAIATIITYERNAFGNKTGDLVQPIDVYNFTKGQFSGLESAQ